MELALVLPFYSVTIDWIGYNMFDNRYLLYSQIYVTQ